MSRTNESIRMQAQGSEQVPDWRRFRRVCGLAARSRSVAGPRAADSGPAGSVAAETSTNLHAELDIQREMQKRLAVEFATALEGFRRTQRAVQACGGPCLDLDRRLEREVVELAMCEEAYELVCEEVELVRTELRRRAKPPRG